jgi:phospholipase/carboxylesterase
VSFVPDYFASVGLTAESYDRETFSRTYGNQVRNNLTHAITCLQALADVDGTRLGIVGFSLGGYFGFFLAAGNEAKALVSYYGAYPYAQGMLGPNFRDALGRVKPPVLMLHGDADQLVPIAAANAVSDWLSQNGKEVQLVTYPGVPHTFIADQRANAKSAAADSRTKVAAFLETSLK